MPPLRRACLAAALALAACAAPAPDPDALSADDEDGLPYVSLADGPKADGFTPSNGPLTFGAACAPGDRLTIAAVGDVLLHGPLQQQAFADADGFRSLWAEALPLLSAADVAYANLEGPTAAGVDARGRDVGDPGRSFGTNGVYTSYPQFNYHPDLVTDLIASGVDVVSTANNHSLDRRSLGVDRTLDALEAAGLPYTGTIRAGAERVFHTLTRTGGFTLGWLACTYGTNGIPDRDDQVLHCYEDRDEVLSTIRALAARPDVDAVIATPHWGYEYQAMPHASQVDLAHEMLEAGALAVLGGHPHVLQPWERHVTEDGRETFVIYSLGNFVSNQNGLAKRSTLLLLLGLTRTAEGVRVHGVRYVPMFMDKGGRRELVALSPGGPHADSLGLTLEMFGGYNLARAGDPLVLDPQCDPTWRAPRLTPAFVGDACSRDEDCDFAADARCHDAGFCTVPCEGYCPDRAGRAPTFCVTDGDGGACVSRSSTANHACADVPGTAPAMADRHVGDSGAAPAQAEVCLPTG